MKRIAVLVALITAICLGGVLANAATVASPELARGAAASGTPEIDNANVTQSLKGRLGFVRCVGEDTLPYVTMRGSLAGSEAETTPGFTDYSLSGSLTVTGITWTINASTKRGVLTGAIKLVDSTGIPEYSGKIIMITDGFPAAGAAIPARGWIVASFAPADDGVAPPGDDTLLANVEWLISSTGPSTVGVSGAFGDSAPFSGIANFSVVTNVAPKALDGVC